MNLNEKNAFFRTLSSWIGFKTMQIVTILGCIMLIASVGFRINEFNKVIGGLIVGFSKLCDFINLTTL